LADPSLDGVSVTALLGGVEVSDVQFSTGDALSSTHYDGLSLSHLLVQLIFLDRSFMFPILLLP
jgi:hypothetical protein